MHLHTQEEIAQCYLTKMRVGMVYNVLNLHGRISEYGSLRGITHPARHIQNVGTAWPQGAHGLKLPRVIIAPASRHFLTVGDL